ncbi:MAG: glutathione S-transferase family protein [Alphaproteobacteria bacterium]|nr:glutathione S-transferase family protein [Alphaproteobacteria bacterium]
MVRHLSREAASVARYRIFGSELSPYSVKVRAWFRYKGIAHDWLTRTPANQAEYEAHARLPLVPLVITPESEGIQDSTPIMERFEAAFPEPASQPGDPMLAFLSALLEEYGDEWGNKHMFHYRWRDDADQVSAAGRIARSMLPDADEETVAERARAVRERMVPRVSFVGSSPETAPVIEASFARQLELLEAHLEGRRYLFGGRPAFADFGIAAQVWEAWTDPTGSTLVPPRTRDWCRRMQDPANEGPFEAWEALAPTLEPLLAEEVGARFLPWSDANARAIADGAESFAVDIAGGRWTQAPQRYHARSLRALREKYAALADRAALDPVLETTGCRAWLG